MTRQDVTALSRMLRQAAAGVRRSSPDAGTGYKAAVVNVALALDERLPFFDRQEFIDFCMGEGDD